MLYENITAILKINRYMMYFPQCKRALPHHFMMLYLFIISGAPASSPVVVQQYPGNSLSLCVCLAI